MGPAACAGGSGGVHGQAHAVLRQQLQCMEATLFAGCGGDPSNSEEPEGAACFWPGHQVTSATNHSQTLPLSLE